MLATSSKVRDVLEAFLLWYISFFSRSVLRSTRNSLLCGLEINYSLLECGAFQYGTEVWGKDESKNKRLPAAEHFVGVGLILWFHCFRDLTTYWFFENENQANVLYGCILWNYRVCHFIPESVAPLWVLPGVVASGSSCGSSPMEKEALLGSPMPEVSSPSLSAEMANFGNKLGRGPWFTLSVSVEWDSEGLVGGQNRVSWDEQIFTPCNSQMLSEYTAYLNVLNSFDLIHALRSELCIWYCRVYVQRFNKLQL